MTTLTKTLGAWIGRSNKTAAELTQNPSFCSMAWNHQFMDPTGRVKPCCRFGEKYRPAENDLNKSRLTDIFFGSWMSKIRRDMIAGKRVKGCERCYQEEDAGKRSLRQRYNDNAFFPLEDLVDIKKPNIRWIELAISNNCNLACRMCDSRYSYKWFDEERASGSKVYSPQKHTKMNIEEIFPFIDSLMHIKFTGGEPLVTPDHWRLIKKLVKERDCNEMFLNYSTNCTIQPKESWIELWNNFRYVEFALSFDSANPAEAEYIRWPAKFETIEETTKKFLDLEKDKRYQNILRTTVSLLNVYHLPETIQWWYDHRLGENILVNPTHLTHPQILSVTVLPLHLKDLVSKKYDEFLQGDLPEKFRDSLLYIKNHMYSQDRSDLLPELKKYLERTDSYRSQDFFDSYPHFSDIFTGTDSRALSSEETDLVHRSP